MSQVDAAADSKVNHNDKRELLAKALAARQRKIEKSMRRKRYDDLQVQGTNNSSIVSKRLVEMLYYSKIRPQETPWFECFVAKPKNRLPSINRGYLIRMESVRRSIEKIIAHHQKQSQRMGQPHTSQVRIVNLGCGFDPLAFQLLETFGDSLFFLDVDYPDLVKGKLLMMQQSSKITGIIGTQIDPSDSSVEFQTANYALVGCDLKDLDLYERILETVCGQAEITIFIAEVSLAYMKPQDADLIIELLSKVPKSHILVLEQILPYGRDHVFAQKMLAHFKKLRSPIQCVEKYPSRADQERRFRQFYDNVLITDLFENWRKISGPEKLEINDIEDFDEWEEFILFCHHYVLIHSFNDTSYSGDERKLSETSVQSPHSTLAISNTVHEIDNPLLLKFPAVCAIDENTIFVHGGANQSRSDATFLLGSGNLAVVTECTGERPGARMCHSATAISGGVLIVGGRTRPRSRCGDAYFFKNGLWTKMGSPFAPRSRHCAMAIDGKVLVFGGMDDSHSSQHLFESFDPITGEWQEVNVVSKAPPNLRAACMAYNGSQGIIFGGFDQSHEPLFNKQAYTFIFDGSDVVLSEITMPLEVCCRIGANCEFLNKNTLLVVGGIGREPLNSTICTYDLETGIVKNINTNGLTQAPPLFIGHGLAAVNINAQKAVKVVCGGAVCYSFGSAYSGIFTIKEKLYFQDTKQTLK